MDGEDGNDRVKKDVRLVDKWGVKLDEIITELKLQTQLAGPLLLISFLQYSLRMISVMLIGHLGHFSLSAFSMASSFAGASGFSLMLGMGRVLETLCGQAYGAKRYHMVGVQMQRAMVVLSLVAIPIAVIWAYTGKIFRFLKQDPEISEEAGVYAFWLIPSIFPYGLLQCEFRFLQSQRKISPLLMSIGVTCLFHIVMSWSLIFKLGFGNVGAALSLTLSYWTNVLILAIYIKLSPTCEKTWTGFSKEGLEDLLGFLKLAAPSALILCLDYWWYESLVFMVGLLSNAKLETSMMSISLITSSLLFKIPLALGSAVSTRVSNELGAGRPYAAHHAVQVAMLLAILQGLLISLIAIVGRRKWGYLFTNEEEVVKYFALVIPLLALSNFMDGIQGVLSGVARGCCWQKISVYVNFGAYYLVGLPSALILTFVLQFRGKGIWMGIVCGSSVHAFLLSIISLSANWEEEAIKAKDRLRGSNKSWKHKDT